MSQTGIEKSRGTLILGLIDRHSTPQTGAQILPIQKKRDYTEPGSPWDSKLSVQTAPTRGRVGAEREERRRV